MSERRVLLIVWWSMTGGTRQLAASAEAGAQRARAAGLPGVELEVRRVAADQAGPDDVLAASGFLFATPENLGAMAGRMKDFFDRTYYAGLDRLGGRPYATIVCAGSDGHGAARQIDRIATGWRLRQAAPALIVRTHAQTTEAILAPKTILPGELAAAAELGEALAAGIALGVI